MCLGQGAVMAKIDLRRADRILPVRREDRRFLGMKWNGQYYVDLAIPFGLRSAPKLFTRFADVLQHIVAQIIPSDVFIQHYLDDFFFVGPPGSEACQRALTACVNICTQLEVPLASEKMEGPASCITFLGLTLDSEQLELRVPEEKLVRLRQELDFWRLKKGGTKRKLLSLIGLLQYCCQAISYGRPFL